MIEFLEYSNKVKELYIGKDTINKVIEAYKKSIVKNEESIKNIYNIDKKYCNINFNIKKAIDLLETYKDKEPIQDVNKQVICVTYYANPYITINLCMQSLLKKTAIISLTEHGLTNTNMILIKIFNKVLEDFKICKMIENKELNKEEKEYILKNQIKVICVGNTNTYCYFKKNNKKELEYVPFRNMAMYCDDEDYLDLQLELYKYAVKNGIEAEVYDDLDEFIECTQNDYKLEYLITFIKDEKTKEILEKELEKDKLYINKNPFKNESFKIDIV